MVAAATLYNGLQHFVPETWERYYYNPTLNPFELPFILSLFIISVALILLVSVALLDDLFHQTSLEVAFFYLVGLAASLHFSFISFSRWSGSGWLIFALWPTQPGVCPVFGNREPILMPAEPVARKCGQKEFVRIVVPSMNSISFRSVERSRQFVNQSGISASALLEP